MTAESEHTLSIGRGSQDCGFCFIANGSFIDVEIYGGQASQGRDGCFSAGEKVPGDETWALEALGFLGECISPSRILMHTTCISRSNSKIWGLRVIV